MSGNTGESPPRSPSLAPEKPSLEDDLESAKILFSEGLLEESKRVLYRMLLHSPQFRKGRELLAQIQKHELEKIHDSHPRTASKSVTEDPDDVIRRLEGDLGINSDSAGPDPSLETWAHPSDLDAQSHLDLGIAFFEMGCFRDAERELRAAVRQVLQSSSELGETGLSATALLAESLILLGEAFDAKMLLEAPLSDAGLMHEDKTAIYYLMGRAEEALGHPASAKGWYGKVLQAEPFFRDAEFRNRIL